MVLVGPSMWLVRRPKARSVLGLVVLSDARVHPRWRGKVAIVTGASAGIGWAVCEALAAAGMRVVGGCPGVLAPGAASGRWPLSRLSRPRRTCMRIRTAVFPGGNCSHHVTGKRWWCPGGRCAAARAAGGAAAGARLRRRARGRLPARRLRHHKGAPTCTRLHGVLTTTCSMCVLPVTARTRPWHGAGDPAQHATRS